MIDYAILEEYGTTNDRLKQFFTAKEPTSAQKAKMTPAEIRARERDIKQRANFEKWLSGLLQEHIVFSLSNHSKYAGVDMAWDSFPVNDAVVPLMKYCQGRVDMAKIGAEMEKLPEGGNYLRKNDAGEVIGIDMPKFFEVNINLIRSIISRRRAAQDQKYGALWPYFKYEPRDQSQVGKLRADMVSQRMDIMADQYGYRHQQSQETLNMLLYGEAISFPRCHWEREVQLEMVPGGIKRDEKGKLRTQTKVVKEGISWTMPHPSRVFYDNQYPLVSINNDDGCEYVGFWDVCRWGDVANNRDFFNRYKVSYTSGMVDWFSTYWAYFNQYFTTIIPPSMPQARGDNVNFTNDRKNQIGLFTGQMEQVSCIFTHLWIKVRPQNWGWGKYPHPIWVHCKVAGDATVVYAQICPSSPGAVASFNRNDQRLFNISMAHEIMPFQDQLTNLFSQLLETVKQDLFSVCVLNTDVFPDNEDGKKAKAEFEALMQNKATYATMNMLEVSFSKMRELGINPEQAFTVVRAKPNTAIEQIFKAITTTIDMAERLMVMSQQEQGQQVTHEMSATESQKISVSTDTMYNFISDPLDESRAAKKRICYESLVACGSDEVDLTVAARYPAEIAKAAGFQVAGNDIMGDVVGYTKLTGSKVGLVHDYCFTARDGGDRPASAAAATVLVQMLQSIGNLESDIQRAVISAMGKEKVFEIINTIYRCVDAGVDMKLEVKPGESDDLLMGESMQQQLISAVQRMGHMLQKDSQDLTAIHQAISAIFEVIGKTNPQAAAAIAQAMPQQTPQAPPGQTPPGQQQQPPQL